MLKSKNVLVVEDDRQISEIIKAYFEKDGWHVDCAFNGNDGLSLFNNGKYNLAVLDIMLGDVSGDTICKQIRKKSDMPVILLTAKSKEQDKLNGLYMGADDYITKPFSPKELVARAYAVMRRYNISEKDANIISFDEGRLVIDSDKCQVTIDGRTVDLTSTEFKILSVLASKPNKVFSRNDLVFYVMNSRYAGDGRTIDAHVKNIRKKLDLNPSNPKYIITVIGVGYKLGVEADENS